MGTVHRVSFLGMNCFHLSHGGYEALVCPDMGGNCLRLAVPAQKAELLRTPKTQQALAENPNVYGMPLLFPPNRIADGVFVFEGRQYAFPINEPARTNHLHGVLSRTPIIVEALESGNTSASLLMRYRATAQTPYLAHPNAFSLALRYTLDDCGLNQELTIRNDSTSLMPFGVGFHTTLNLPFVKEAESEEILLHVPCHAEWEFDRSRMLPTGRERPTKLQEALNQGLIKPRTDPLSALVSLSGPTARLVDRISGLSVTYTVSEEYPFLMIWNAACDLPFVCLEPQSWLVNAPNLPLPHAKTGILPLKPFESRTFQTRLALVSMEDRRTVHDRETAF
jgi:aldose 1-epimerase